MKDSPTIDREEALDSRRWAQAIRSLRKEKGWSQKDLADRLDIHPQSISEIERGKERLTLERLHRLLDALGYSATVSVKKRESSIRADWGPIFASDPESRALVRHSRKLAETLADELYRRFQVENVLCFGSLVEDGGKHFTEQSDIDLIVEGLDPSMLISAHSVLELDVMEGKRSENGPSFDLVLAKDLDRSISELVREHEAVLIPKPHQQS